MAIRQIGTLLASAIMLAGCASESTLFRADWAWWNKGGSSQTVEPSAMSFSAAPPEALVAPDGTCPAADPAAPGRPIGLGMTECELIKVAGPTERIEIGVNERGQRTAVISYLQGESAGIYRFSAGALVSVERAPDPPKPQRQQRPPRNRSAS